jgi:hypothetical protein
MHIFRTLLESSLRPIQDEGFLSILKYSPGWEVGLLNEAKSLKLITMIAIQLSLQLDL